MISSPLRFKQPCGQKEGERQTQAKRGGAAINHLIRMRHLFMTGVIKPTELLIIFQKTTKMSLFY